MDIVNNVKQKFGEKIEIIEGLDCPALKVKKENFIDLVTELKENNSFNFLVFLTAVDYDDRVEGVYQLMNIEAGTHIRIKVDLDKEKPSIPSLVSLYKAADLQEREAFDLLGVNYEGHPNLKRILCPDDFVGHPLRKDFSMRDRGVQ